MDRNSNPLSFGQSCRLQSEDYYQFVEVHILYHDGVEGDSK